MTSRKTISVYGSSKPEPGSEDYRVAEEMGRLLAESGYAVMTGGYGGTMEGVSKGAKEAGGHVIGVTAGVLEHRLGRKGPNQYIDEIIRYDELSTRMLHIVSKCDGAISLPGGIGTLAEVVSTWSFIQVGEIEPMPLILIGDHWQEVFDLFFGDGRYISDHFMQVWKIAQDPEHALRLLKDW